MADFDFNWNDSWQVEALQELDTKLAAFGGALAGAMQQFAPVDTGFLRLSIADTYDTATHTLTIMIGAPYAVYAEFGTRNQAPHPFIRPAIVEYAAVFQEWGLSAELLIHPPAQISEPLQATTSGFRLPKHQKLTAGQAHHVKTKLIPTSRKFAAKFKRRKIGFKIVGPGDKP